MKLHKTILAATALTGAIASMSAFAQTKWDLASAYPPANFHAESDPIRQRRRQGHGRQAEDYSALERVAVQGTEIKRGADRWRADGWILLVNFQNEWQLFGADGVPFLADSYDSSMKLYGAQKPMMDKKLGEQGMMLLYAVPWPPQGIYSKKPLASAADLKGGKWRAYSPATAALQSWSVHNR